MVEEKELQQRLNLVSSSHAFVLREIDSHGRATVISLAVIPRDDGIYWIGGVTTLKNGTALPSVFRVDTDAAGSLLSVFWLIHSNWYTHDDDDAFSIIGIDRKNAFPFDWRYNVRVESDAFHSP